MATVKHRLTIVCDSQGEYDEVRARLDAWDADPANIPFTTRTEDAPNLTVVAITEPIPAEV